MFSALPDKARPYGTPLNVQELFINAEYTLVARCLGLGQAFVLAHVWSINSPQVGVMTVL